MIANDVNILRVLDQIIAALTDEIADLGERATTHSAKSLAAHMRGDNARADYHDSVAWLLRDEARQKRALRGQHQVQARRLELELSR